MTNPPDREIIVFSAARRLPPGQRAAYLDEACGGDTALRQRVEELLRARDEAGAFLESPASGPAGTDRITPIRTEKVGDRIGRYKLLQQIGEGGCGVVYMAEQEEPVHRQVALKVIKLGMDTKQVIARFEAERQALAMMDHPNIAKVLDAGATETGRPYFVMELVRGIKITDYCDQNALSTQERLDLFIQVCRAIQHAHQKGIIHRDIKPSNILVTMDDRAPVPKVIDFGIAKATQGKLTDRTLFTAFEQFIGTPAYMSPEQAEMKVQDIDTRSDIYSLGVLLYELLTGRTPFDPKELLAAGVEEMRRIIREKEPARPSTRLSTMMAAELTTVAGRRQVEAARLAPLIRGDLDWIVMKSLEKDRSRRYETTNGLASDIRCHLNNEPVTARPPNNFYKLRKFARRNRSILITAGIIVVLLLIGFRSVVLMSAREQTAREQVKTEQRIAESEASARDESDDDFKLLSYELIRELLLALNSAKRDQFEDAGPLLDKIIERVKTDLKDSPEIQAKMYNVLADAYDYSGSKDISKVDEQILWLRQQAVTIQRRLYGNDSLELAASLNGLGLAYDRRGDWAETCEPPLREALAIEMNRLGNQSAAAATTLGHLTFASPTEVMIRRRILARPCI